MIGHLYNKIQERMEAQHDRFVLFVPVWMGLGIAFYFHLRHEPFVWAGAALCLAFLLLWRLARTVRLLRLLAFMGLLASFGMTLAQYRTYSIHSPVLAHALPMTRVTGQVEEIAPTPKGSKLLLRHVTIDGLPPAQTPDHISVTLRSYNDTLITGQTLRLRAGLFPPPGPALPGGFDFNRHFFFREIGAVGYGVPPVETLDANRGDGADSRFAEFRHRLTEAIRSHFREPAGAVAAAFITGETRAIPESINDDMRTAGLYHLLAVSGMNLSVVAGLAFYSFRLLLALIPALALRYPIKKWAALLALLASYVYLRVSGCPVSAERAFFMVSLIFVAILLDRDPQPLRSVAFSAFCILLYEPESVLTASFQLSYSATAALIASYEWATRFASRRTDGWGIRRVAFYFAAVMTTSLVAWLGTEPLIIYHFSQFSSYSLIANTIAEPLVSFLLMPLVIAGVLLLPLGLAGLVFTPMQYGVDLLLVIARTTARLPHAMWIVPPPTDGGFLCILLGLVWIYFWNGASRWLGLLPVMLGLATALLYRPPDLLVSADAKEIAYRGDDGQMRLLRGRAANMNAEQWLRASIATAYAEPDEHFARCDALGCVASIHGHPVAAIRKEEALPDDCRMADIVIAPFSVSAGSCPARIILDKDALEKGGAAALWLRGDSIELRQTRKSQGDRPWAPR
jgi:competence protein ComEC